MSYITTLNGKFDYSDIESNKLNLDDMCHALSFNNRFNGHILKRYSVADHSINLYDAIHDNKLYLDFNPIMYSSIRLYALVHDLPEALTGDMVSPLKEMLPEYKVIENRISDHVFKFFGWKFSDDVKAIVKTFDTAILGNEMMFVHEPANIPQHFLDNRIRGFEVVSYPPSTAKFFLKDLIERTSREYSRLVMNDITDGIYHENV